MLFFRNLYRMIIRSPASLRIVPGLSLRMCKNTAALCPEIYLLSSLSWNNTLKYVKIRLYDRAEGIAPGPVQLQRQGHRASAGSQIRSCHSLKPPACYMKLWPAAYIKTGSRGLSGSSGIKSDGKAERRLSEGGEDYEKSICYAANYPVHTFYRIFILCTDLFPLGSGHHAPLAYQQRKKK